jgi:tetratricopeptide (TPR) repeat protein
MSQRSKEAGSGNHSAAGPGRAAAAGPLAGREDWLLGLLLLAAIIMAYQPAWHAGFIWDDDRYVTENPLLGAPDGLRRIWFSLDSPSQYFPLTYTTFYVEHALWGLKPAGYHWDNIVLHAANALLAWRLLRRLRVSGAWLGAALFALHPVQAQSVAWVAERKNVLMVFFFLLSLLAWTRFIDEPTKRPWRFYALALVFYAFSLSAKTTACTLPAALLLVLWLQKRPIGWRRLAEAAPFVALALGIGLVTVWWERYHLGTHGKLFEIGPVERVLIASRALWFYAGKLLWAANLAFSYPRWTISASAPLAYVWLLGTAALALVIWRLRRWAGRSLEVAALFFAATLGPMLGFIMLSTFQYSFVADHYQYLACLGPLALLAAGLELGWERMTKQSPVLRVIFCAVLLAALGAMTWHQCGMYADAETLWRATIARNPGSWLAHNNLGALLCAKGDTEEAIAQYRQALEIRPEDTETQNNLGVAFFVKGKTEAAIAQYRKILERTPENANALNNLGNALAQKGDMEEAIAQYHSAQQIQPDYAEAHYNLGNAMVKKGEINEALEQYRKAVESKPDYAEALNNLGDALVLKGDFEEAIAQLQRALTIKPDYADAHYDLGNALFEHGRLDGAIAEYRKALEIKADYAEADNNLGTALCTKGELGEGIVCYRQAVGINPRYAEAYANLGDACLRNRQIKQAMDSWQQALAIKPDNADVLNNLAWLLATTSDPALRKGAAAVALAQHANQLRGGSNPMILRTLAAAYAETGSYGVAAVTARRALELAIEQKNDALGATLQKEIELYEAGAPVREAK